MTKVSKEMLSSQMRELNAEMSQMEIGSPEYNAAQAKFENMKREYQTQNLDDAAVATPVDNSLVKQIREALGSNNKTIRLREGEIVASAHTTGKEMKGLLEPLYTDSILSKIGVRMYKDLPQGDVVVPVLNRGNVGWAGEVAAAGAAGETFTSVTLQPKRLTAFVDISKKFIVQDGIGAEEAIKRDLVNAIKDKLEATVFGYGAVSTTAPAGLFNGATLATAKTFVEVCAIEAGLEEKGVKNLTYVLSPKAKADLRAMAKSSKNTQLVLEGGAIDGVPAYMSANVIDAASSTKGAYIVGDFSNLAVGAWGDIEITVDEYSQAVNGCVRLVVNAYFDVKACRANAFAYGDTRHA